MKAIGRKPSSLVPRGGRRESQEAEEPGGLGARRPCEATEALAQMLKSHMAMGHGATEPESHGAKGAIGCKPSNATLPCVEPRDRRPDSQEAEQA
jgi:hypothetical protein